MKNILFFLLFVFLVFGCQKSKLKKPTEVAFKIDINKSTSSDGRLFFTDGKIWLSSFKVDGTRQKGEPISFTRTFTSGLSVDFSSNSISDLKYDIPQGVYTDLDIRFQIVKNNNNYSLCVNGKYMDNNSNLIPLRFEFNSNDTFEIEGEGDDGSKTIVLDKDIPLNSLIKLDPIYWFDIVPLSMLENANKVNLNGQLTILINENNNEDIYDLVVDRIDQALEAVFKP